MVIKGIIFDLDGTIVNSEYVQFLAFEKYLKSSFGKILPWDDWLNKYRGKTSPEIMNGFKSVYGITFDIDEGNRIRRGFYRDLVEQGRLEIIPGFQEFYNWIKSKNIASIIATNSHSSGVELTLRATGLDDMNFLSIEDFNDFGHFKPDHRAFELAAERMGLLIKECAVFEDYPANISSAKEAGAVTVAIASEKEQGIHYNEADLIIKDYHDERLKPYISSLLS
ncbi:MAG: HAD family hydrolase [Candidatus Hodarchaeales archaeon]